MINFRKYIDEYFKKIIEVYGCSKQNELDNGQSYCVEFSSKTFVIKLEKYRREFYATLYKIGNSDNEINLFNLLNYLNRTSTNVPKAEYFLSETDIEECYRKQLNHISNNIYDNFTAINDFFSTGNHESNVADIEKFMLNKYPELFKKDR